MEKGAAANLVHVGGFDVWLGAVRDAVLQHLLYPRYQKDVGVGVGHGKDALRERKDGGKRR